MTVTMKKIQCVAWLGLMGTLAPVAATQVNDGAAINIHDISADLPGKMDGATALGRELSPSLRARGTAVPSEQAVVAPAKARPGPVDAVTTGLPPVASPALSRTARRAAPQDAKAAVARPVYTPDFSRQKMSFAQLIGKERIDLPDSSNVIGQPTGADVANVPAEDAWTLADIVSEGLAFSPVFRRSQAQLDTAVARRKQARADLLPVLSTSMKGGRAKVRTDGLSEKESNQYRTSMTRLVQPVYNQTYIGNLRSTIASEQSADYRMEAVRESVILSLVQATSALAASRVVIGFADEQESQLNEVFRYLETRAQAGASSTADLERARTRVLAARQNRIELQANYKSALYEVERLLGETPKALWLPYLNQLPALPQTKDELRRLMHEHNTELKALQMDIDAQQALVSASYGKMLPSVALSAEHDVQRNITGPTAKQTDKRILLTMNWAVSLGGKEVYGAQETKAELRSRETRNEEERKRLEQMLEADFALLQSATQRIATGESEQKAAETVVEAVREQLQTGRIGSLLDALDAFDRLFAARNRQVQALSQQIIAQAQLLRLIGMLGQITANVPASPGNNQQNVVPDTGPLSSQSGS